MVTMVLWICVTKMKIEHSVSCISCWVCTMCTCILRKKHILRPTENIQKKTTRNKKRLFLEIEQNKFAIILSVSISMSLLLLNLLFPSIRTAAKLWFLVMCPKNFFFILKIDYLYNLIFKK